MPRGWLGALIPLVFVVAAEIIGSHFASTTLAVILIAVSLPVAVKFNRWLDRRQRRREQTQRRQAFDCDYQNDAFARGNLRLAIYGRYQP